MKKRSLTCCLLAILAFSVNAQKHIVVLGSSTAVGTGANPVDSSWVARLQSYFRQNTTVGDPDTIITNLANGGYTTANVLPDGSPPQSGIEPDEDKNITAALALNPDVIIVNLPSNDTDWWFTKKRTMDNLRLIFQTASNAGKRIFITTTQPRNFAEFDRRDSLRTLADSININFGVYAIDFWTDLVSTDGTLTIHPDVNADGVHVNNTGHRLLFQQVVNKDIFFADASLPMRLNSFKAQIFNGKAKLEWQTIDEDQPVMFEIERSVDGRQFTSVHQLQGYGGAVHYYTWTDDRTPAGKVFYRLRITENTKTTYSSVVSVTSRGQEMFIKNVAVSPNRLNVTAISQGNTPVSVSIFNLAGMMLHREQRNLISTEESFALDISSLPVGSYLLHLQTSKGTTDTIRFLKSE